MLASSCLEPHTKFYNIKFRLRCQANPALPWNEINNRLWSKCFAAGVSATFCPSTNATTWDNKILAPVPSPFVSSNTNVANALQQDIAKDNAEDSNIMCNHNQLNPITFKLVTPIKANRCEGLLKGYSNQDLVHCVITSFRQGFTLKYQGPKVNREPNNLKSVYQFKDKLWASPMKEVHLGRMIDPFGSQPITPLICSPVGLVEKKNLSHMCQVTHLSYLKGSSINAFIHPVHADTHYQTFEAAVNLVAKAG